MTEPSFLLDANICIYILIDAASRSALTVQDQEIGRVVTSSITYAEVMRGIPVHEQIARGRAEQLFQRVPPLPFDRAAALTYAELPFRRARFDRLIAAHALALGLTLVTNNVRDFADIPGLRIENWTK